MGNSKFHVTPERTACVLLLYGDYHDLHKRVLDSFAAYMPKKIHLVIWCNQVCDQTRAYLQTFSKKFADCTITYSDDNIPKYKVMRKIAADISVDKYDWFLWWDDDSYAVNKDWFSHMVAHIQAREKDNISCIGKVFYLHRRDGMSEFIAESPWYRGKPPLLYPNRSKQRVPAARFATGGYWWLRVDVMKAIDWPDPRLSHNGGDTLLGEALYQMGYPIHDHAYGVKINQSKRRGLHEKRAGAK